jgi:hypothetical protein
LICLRNLHHPWKKEKNVFKVVRNDRDQQAAGFLPQPGKYETRDSCIQQGDHIEVNSQAAIQPNTMQQAKQY